LFKDSIHQRQRIRFTGCVYNFREVWVSTIYSKDLRTMFSGGVEKDQHILYLVIDIIDPIYIGIMTFNLLSIFDKYIPKTSCANIPLSDPCVNRAWLSICLNLHNRPAHSKYITQIYYTLIYYSRPNPIPMTWACKHYVSNDILDSIYIYMFVNIPSI
jgi:hypothetical protein